jgi:hypothetical protein
MQFLFVLLLPATLAHQHHLARRDRFDIGAVLNTCPYNAYESKMNNNPASIDYKQRACEDFAEATAQEYGTKPSKMVHNRRPLRDISNKQVAAAAENRRYHEDNDRAASSKGTQYGEGGDGEEELGFYSRKPVVELGFGEPPLCYIGVSGLTGLMGTT